MYIYYQLKYRWIANQQGHRKNQFADEPEGLQQFQDHRWKALGGENLDLTGLFSVIIFDLLIFKTSENMAPTKIYQPGSDLPLRVL